MSGFKVQDGNNMPIQAPLSPDPFVPYVCPENSTLSVICRAPEGILEKYLAPTPFTPLADLFIIYVADFTNCDKIPFMDGGIIVPVAFEGGTGGNFLFEYEDNDSAIAAGRDLWGYPKKFGAFQTSVGGDEVSATITRHGTELINIACDLSQPVDLPDVVTMPHLNIHVQPGPDGKVLSKRVIARDTSPDFKQTSHRTGAATARLGSLPQDPLGELGPMEVLGGSYTVGDYLASETHGWGRTIATLV
jgi:acetoacetate decarboxylase